MDLKTVIEVLKYFPILWKNLFFKHIIFISVLLILLTIGRNHPSVSTILSFFQDSNTRQLKLILKQVEQERDGYKQKETTLNIEFASLEKQKEILAKEKSVLQSKAKILEKELSILRNTPTSIPSTNKNELAKQFTDLGFEATVKECVE